MAANASGIERGAAVLDAEVARRKLHAVSAAAPIPEDEESVVRLIRGSDLKPEPISWLWRNYLARGKLHMIAGAPGAGKTTIAMALVAAVTAGGRWPDGSRADTGNALIWSGEDDPNDTLLPRLILSGAVRERVYFVGDVLADGNARPFDPSCDIAALEREAALVGDVRLLIVDPIVNSVTGDSNKNAETRRALQPIVELATRLRAAAVGISHFTKGSAGRDPLERVTGSIAFGALPRIVFAAAKATDEEGNTKRLLVRTKSNIGPDGGGFEYELQPEDLPGFPGLMSSRVLWGKPLEGSARDLLATVEDIENPNGDRGAIAEAIDFLRDALAQGPVSARGLKADASGAGHAWRTVQEAAKRLEVQRKKGGMEEGWTWSLPLFPKMQGTPKMHEGAASESVHLLAPSDVVDPLAATGEAL